MRMSRKKSGKSRDPRKQASLRLLAQHPALIEAGLSHSTLANFIGIYVQLETIRPEVKAIVEALGLSKQIALLTVPDEDAKLQLAQAATVPGTTVRDLKAEILLKKEASRVAEKKGKPGPKGPPMSPLPRSSSRRTRPRTSPGT